MINSQSCQNIVDKNKSEKIYLQIINMLVQFVFVFFSVFFSVFVYEISQDINFVMIYSLFMVVICLLAELFIYKFANNKVLRVLFKISFLLCLIAILLTFTISTSTLYMVFVTQFFYAVALVFYYTPNEIATLDKNSKNQMRRFIGIGAILSLIAKVLSPFLSGFIIHYVSYFVLFGCISLIAVACFILSFKVKRVCEVDSKINFKYFLKQVHSYKGIRLGYLGYGLYKFSQDGVIDVLLPVLIFLRTGGNLSVGLYSALATLIAGLVLILYLYFCKNKAVAMYVATAFLVVVSILIIAVNSLVVFFVYYFVKKISFEILRNGIFENVFNLPKGTQVEKQNIEQHLTFSIYNRGFSALAYIVSLVIYNFMRNDIAISVILSMLSLVQIISTVLVVKSDKLRDQNK